MLLFTLAACWTGGFAVLGGNLNNDFVVETGWQDEPCSWVIEHTPASGEEVQADGLEVVLEVDGPFNGSGGIVGVDTLVSVDTRVETQDSTVTLTPREPLATNTTYTWWVDTRCQYVEQTFRTSRFGSELELSPEELAALSFDLVMDTESELVVPVGGDEVLEGLLRGWVWGRGSLDKDGHLSLAQVDAGAQDYCQVTQSMTGYFSYPEPQISWTGEQIALRTDIGLMSFEELRLDAVIAPDGSALGQMAVSGLVGVGQLSTYYGQDYCEMVQGTATSCISCLDPEGCVRIRVEGAAGRQQELAVSQVEEERCHALCLDNSEECELE